MDLFLVIAALCTAINGALRINMYENHDPSFPYN
jgi:hypothetical protein